MRLAYSHFTDRALLEQCNRLHASERCSTAESIACLAEVDARKLYLPAAYPSLHAYCVEEFHMSEDEACRRIRVARAARDFPALLPALAEGRLHITAVVLLAPHLTSENAAGLLAAAEHRSAAGVRQLLAERFPRPDVPNRVEPLPGPAPALADSPGMTESAAQVLESASAPARIEPGSSAPARMEGAVIPGQVTPLAARRFGVQLTIGQQTHDKLRYAQALLAHVLPAKDLALLLDRSLDALIRELERRKFAPGARTRPSGRRKAGSRHIPAAVRRAVWERDRGQCTFESERGRRCAERARLEFDHVEPFARSGQEGRVPQPGAEGIRLRCRAHNQYAAEEVYGAAFMEGKREAARQRQAAQRHEAGRRRQSAPEREAERPASEERGDVYACLRSLQLPPDQARRAAAHGQALADAPLQERVRAALAFHGRVRFPSAHGASRSPIPDLTPAR